MNRKIKSVINIVILLLISNVFECSSKVSKLNERLYSKMKKAGVRVKSSEVDCSATSVTSITGRCLSLEASSLQSYIPSDFQSVWSVLEPVITNVFPSGPSMCFGDYQGSKFSELSSTLCDNIPMEDNGTFGVLGMSFNKIPCGVDTKVAMCVAFDRCGTFAVSVNGGSASCLAYYLGQATGWVSAVASAAGTVSEDATFSLGFSLGRRFSTEFSLAYKDGNNVKTMTINPSGHLFMDFGIDFPIDFTKFPVKDLSSYISVTIATISSTVDLGDVQSVVTQAIEAIRNTDKSSAKALLNSLLKSSAEATFNISGVIDLTLESVTNGLIPDLSITVNGARIFLTSGTGRSGLEAGVYIRIDTGDISDLINSLANVISNYSTILSSLTSNLTIPSSGLELGIFLTTSGLGFDLAYSSKNIKCLFLFNSTEMSCSMNDKTFTVTKEGLNFVFRQAAAFFDKTGSVIATKLAEEVKSGNKSVVKAATSTVKTTVKNVVKSILKK